MPYFYRKLVKMSQNLSFAAVVIVALRVKSSTTLKAHKAKQLCKAFFYNILRCSLAFYQYILTQKNSCFSCKSNKLLELLFLSVEQDRKEFNSCF